MAQFEHPRQVAAPEPEDIILYEKDPKTKIATITFNRPEFLNAPTSLARPAPWWPSKGTRSR